ncbi:9406_t:CDS:2, partial [Funneliformis geosporum]
TQELESFIAQQVQKATTQGQKYNPVNQYQNQPTFYRVVIIYLYYQQENNQSPLIVETPNTQKLRAELNHYQKLYENRVKKDLGFENKDAETQTEDDQLVIQHQEQLRKINVLFDDQAQDYSFIDFNVTDCYQHGCDHLGIISYKKVVFRGFYHKKLLQELIANKEIKNNLQITNEKLFANYVYDLPEETAGST